MNIREAIEWFKANPNNIKSSERKLLSKTLMDKSGTHYRGESCNGSMVSITANNGLRILSVEEILDLDLHVPTYPVLSNPSLRWASEGEGINRIDPDGDEHHLYWLCRDETDADALRALLDEFRERTEANR